MSSKATRVGHGLAKVLRIDLDSNNEKSSEVISHGESIFSVSSADSYFEKEPTSLEWIQEHIPSRQGIINYLISLVPFVNWITRYNTQWFIGDLVAGVTVGAVVVPQSMAYAKLAELPVEFGLYSAFMGVMIYWLFGTSKDITIGPVAVMSTVTGNIVLHAKATLPEYQGYQIAEALAIIAGSIVCFMGLVRIGWIVEFISLAAVSAFITGASLNIGIGQIPTLMGIASVNNRQSTYLVVIGVLKHLGQTKLDAALGLTALTMLYLYRFICNTCAKRWPTRARIFFFISTLRAVFVILLYTLISWATQHHRASKNYQKAQWKILGHVPRGFEYARVPIVNTTIIKNFASQLPVAVIVLLIEHIAISKSFGRVNNYTINPSQELLAIGITNLFGPFVGAYPGTGSFSRTAIKSKAGVRTPLAGVITGIVVLLAIYALPAVFYWIPQAALAAVIIHAVFDLITPPNTLYQFWRISPLEVIIFLAGVLVTVFSSIENGIYTTVCISVALLLWRVAKAKGRFLGRVKVYSVVGDHTLESTNVNNKNEISEFSQQHQRVGKVEDDDDTNTRAVFLPIDHEDGSNPLLHLTAPYPGVFIYRFSEGFNYPNASHYLDNMVQTIMQRTRRTNLTRVDRPGDRPWNNPGPRKGQTENIDMSLPTLKAVILDMSSVNNVDVTSVQQLVDVRNQLDRYAAPQKVEWHMACINNRWTKRALASAGFGLPAVQDGDLRRWKPIYSVAEIGGDQSAAATAEKMERERQRAAEKAAAANVESGLARLTTEERESPSLEFVNSSRVAVVQGINRPLFHIDLISALQSAISTIERNDGAIVEIETVK